MAPSSMGPSCATPTHIISTVNINVKKGTIVRNLISSYINRVITICFLLQWLIITSSRELFIFLLFYINGCCQVCVCVCVFCVLKGEKQYKSVRSIFLFSFSCVWQESNIHTHTHTRSLRARSSTLEMICMLIGPFHFYTFPDVNFLLRSLSVSPSHSALFSGSGDVTSIIDAKV